MAPGLTAWLSAPAEARAGQPVPLKLNLKNTNAQPVEITLGGHPASDFVVTTPDGKEIWRWSYDHDIQAILELKTLDPREELTFVAEWKQVNNVGDRVAAGIYLVRGVLNLDPPEQWQTTPKQLTIIAQ
jgi:hypothetical protein